MRYENHTRSRRFLNILRAASIPLAIVALDSGTQQTRGRLTSIERSYNAGETRNPNCGVTEIQRPVAREYIRFLEETYDGRATILDSSAIQENSRLIDLEKVQALVPQLDGESRRAHAERILAITRRLADLHIPATSENVRDSIAAIQNAREHYRNQPVFNDTVLFAAGAVTSSPDSGESVYITPEIRRRLSELGVEVKYFSGLLSERQNCDWATPESLENARANVLEAVAETETPITLMFRMHGNEKFLEFGATGFSNQRAAHQTVAFARDIAHAFAERYANPERMAAARRTPDVIIFDDCNIQPFAMDALMREIRAIAEEEHREIPIPSIITSSEQGQYAFRGQLMNRLLFEQNRRTPTFGMLYPDNDLLGSRSINSNAVVMTRDRRNRPLQIG